MKVQLIHSDAKLPSKSTPRSGGWDIYNLEDFKLLSSEVRLCKTGIKIIIPEGYVGLLRGRSGLALQGIDPMEFYDPETNKLLGGVIDNDYRGEVGVILKNLGSKGVEIKKGDRICQIVIIKIWDGEAEEVNDICNNINDSTERGEKGFGSSDPKKFDPMGYLKK